MKVEIISISTSLLVSDTLDTMAAYASRCLREVKASLTCKVTVGDDLAVIIDVVRAALARADAIITIGGVGMKANDFTAQAVAEVVKRPFLTTYPLIDGATLLGSLHAPGLLLEEEEGIIFCLPGNRQEMRYLLETAVLPHLKQQLTQQVKHGWALLRTVGIMESSLKQKLARISLLPHQRITFNSFAGQANIRLWIEADSEEAAQAELVQLKQTVLTTLGDYVYGEEESRLETVIMKKLAQHGRKLALAECFTDQILAKTLARVPQTHAYIIAPPLPTEQAVNNYLDLSPDAAKHDLTRWCRLVAEQLRKQTGADLSLMVYNDHAQGGVQVLVTLASSLGVSVTNRSFGGHPEHINEWACTLGLAHLRRWLLVHHG